jgi:hypothetical protein
MRMRLTIFMWLACAVAFVPWSFAAADDAGAESAAVPVIEISTGQPEPGPAAADRHGRFCSLARCRCHCGRRLAGGARDARGGRAGWHARAARRWRGPRGGDC